MVRTAAQRAYRPARWRALARAGPSERWCRPSNARAPACESKPYSHLVCADSLRLAPSASLATVAYIRWLLEAVPSDYFDSHVLTGITLEFRNECHYGESINAWVTAEATVAEGGSVTAAEEGEEVLYHWLHSDDNDKELMRAKTFWRPR